MLKVTKNRFEAMSQKHPQLALDLTKGLAAVPTNSVDAVTLPGAVDAFCRLSADWGKLGLDAVLAPAIRYAEAGVPVAPRVAFDWAGDAGHLQGAARQHYLLNGAAPKVGDLFRAPGQAEVLRRIARDDHRCRASGGREQRLGEFVAAARQERQRPRRLSAGPSNSLLHAAGAW